AGGHMPPPARSTRAANPPHEPHDHPRAPLSFPPPRRANTRLAYEAEEAFARRFPPPLAEEVAAYLAGQAIPLADHRGIFTDLWEKCARNTRERVRIQLAPANLHWCSDEALEALRDWSAEYDGGLHMHLVE